jgi:hypothetical protein
LEAAKAQGDLEGVDYVAVSMGTWRKTRCPEVEEQSSPYYDKERHFIKDCTINSLVSIRQSKE